MLHTATEFNRRAFLLGTAQMVAAARLHAAAQKTRVGVVPSNHSGLTHPSSREDPLDYARVREMVWKALEYGKPRAGSLEAKIKRGSWVVVKPNIVSLRSRPAYSTGDVTDLRVTKAVIEYVARRSHAGRITLAEGGTYRNLVDPAKDNTYSQNGARVDLRDFDWGDQEFPGLGGSVSRMLREIAAEFPDKKFDYVDLSYDCVRDNSGALRRVEVPRAANGIGAFGARPDYFVTNTLLNCDFLIDVPVMKVAGQCGVTACMKNYVGTAPREAYSYPGMFSNFRLHDQHSVDNRIDPFIADLVAFHPPDFCVVDAIRGLQYHQHGGKEPDQMVRSNFVLAGEDPISMDATAAYMMGFNPWDLEYLHLGIKRGLGTMDFREIEHVGDEPDRLRQRWGKPREWYGRGNREWRVSGDAAADLATWSRHTSPTDTLNLTRAAGAPAAPGKTYGVAARIQADGTRKAFLWVGALGHVQASLNGEQVMDEENTTKYRVGQFRTPVELRAGENVLVFRVQALGDSPQISAVMAGPRNDGDTVEGIRWSA
jgi:uncharacterized protein (DUF362 family)